MKYLYQSALSWLFLLCLSSISVSVYAQDTLVAKINERTDDETDGSSLSIFRDALLSAGMLDALLGNTSRSFTVFAPTNDAMMSSPTAQMYLLGSNETIPRWHRHLVATLRHHVIPDYILNKTEIFNSQRVELMSIHETVTVGQFDQTVQGAGLIESDVIASNGILHTVNKVLAPKFFSETFSKLELQEELGPDPKERIALTDVVDFLGARERLSQTRKEGLTFLGCRIRAFNRLEDYLPQTINGSPDVKYGEFLNSTFKNETIRNFIDYSMIPKNYYLTDLPNGFMELTVPIPNCGHMWVTKNKNILCFNNGCVVETPTPREYIAGNGIGYIVDKCQVCPGIAMLTGFAGDYTTYNMKDTAQFLGASEWNLRDLRLSVGSGEKLTLFAAISTGWSFFNTEDMTRLATDEWKRHQLNLLSHMLVEGVYTQADLQTRFESEGPFNLTSLLNETLEVGFDSSEGKVTINGALVIFGDMQGVDGNLHFITELPLPRSVTHTVYDMAKEDPQFSTQISYIDQLRLDSDMKRLLPLTTFYAPNEAWEGKVTKIQEIAETVLESHIFEKLLWCDVLRDLAGNGTTVTSYNNQTWKLSVNQNGFPCFDTYEVGGGQVGKACVSKCDIIARNGVVHELDSLLLYDPAETRPPSNFIGNVPRAPSAPSPPTVFQRPSDSSLTGDDSPASAPSSKIGFGDEKSGALRYTVFDITLMVSVATSLIQMLN